MSKFLKHFDDNKAFYYFLLIIVFAISIFNMSRYSYVTYEGCVFRIDKASNNIEILYQNFPEMIQNYIKARQEADANLNKQIENMRKN